MFHSASKSILCKSGTSSVTLCTLQQVLDQDHHPLSHQVRVAGPSERGVKFVRPYQLPHRPRHTSDSELIDIQKHSTTDQVILNCTKSIITGNIVQDGPAADFQISSQIPAPAFPKNSDIFFLSSNPFPGLEHEITAIVRSSVTSDAAESPDCLMIYDCSSQKWRRTGRVESGSRCMYTSDNHPRQVLVSNEKSFRLCDHRVSESSASSLLIFCAEKNPHLIPFEEIMSCTSLRCTPHQHLLLSDMHVVVVDERFPAGSLMLMAHCMESRTGTRLSRIRCQETSFARRMRDESDVLVLVSNEHCICLMCLSPVRGVMQPQLSDSAVHTFHLNDFPDALSFSGYDSSRMSRPRDLCIQGLDLIPSPAGFSLVAVTRNCDLFLQDLDLVKDKSEDITADSGEPGDRSGSFSCTRTDASLSLNPQTAEYLNHSIFHISAGMRSLSVQAKGRAANSSKHSSHPCKQPVSCKCCPEWHSGNSIADLHTDTRSSHQPQQQQSSLFLDKLQKFTPLFEQSACRSSGAGGEQTEQEHDEHEGLPDQPLRNLLSNNLLKTWALSPHSQVCSFDRAADFPCCNEFYYPAAGRCRQSGAGQAFLLLNTQINAEPCVKTAASSA
jgi:hypothetical protein